MIINFPFESERSHLPVRNRPAHLPLYYANEQVRRFLRRRFRSRNLKLMERRREQRESSRRVFTRRQVDKAADDFAFDPHLSGSRIKQQKWDTTSQGEQRAASTFDANVLSSDESTEKGKDVTSEQTSSQMFGSMPDPSPSRPPSKRVSTLGPLSSSHSPSKVSTSQSSRTPSTSQAPFKATGKPTPSDSKSPSGTSQSTPGTQLDSQPLPKTLVTSMSPQHSTLRTASTTVQTSTSQTTTTLTSTSIQQTPNSQSLSGAAAASQSPSSAASTSQIATPSVLNAKSSTSASFTSQSPALTESAGQLPVTSVPASKSPATQPSSPSASGGRTPNKTPSPIHSDTKDSSPAEMKSPPSSLPKYRPVTKPSLDQQPKSDHQTVTSFKASSHSTFSSAPSHQLTPASSLRTSGRGSWSLSAPDGHFNQSSTGGANFDAFVSEERRVNMSVLTRQTKEALKSKVLRRSEQCGFPCLNGGHCIDLESCDCSTFQATGHRCQTVPNTGFEREMTCRTWGQYNFETFDGLYYYFPGGCSYTLLKECEEPAQAGIIIQVHNDPECHDAPYNCERSVSIFLPWEGEVRLEANHVSYKGQSLQLPHHIHDLELEQISQYVLVTQHHGFTLAWEGSTGSVYIQLSPEFVGRTCGLCGNFNADVLDDLTTSYGVLTEDVEMFGNSWMESQPHQFQCPMVPSGFPSPCALVDIQTWMKVEEVCAALLDPPFESCHDFVSPLSYMASCTNDLCLSGPGGDVVCQVFSEYARACAHADHPLHDWRSHISQCGKECPSGLQYLECISCCPASCNIERTCIDSKLSCLDGCYCSDGLIYKDGSCVTPSDCPCELHGHVYPSGHTLQEECNNCTCVGGVWNCTDYNCPGECSVTGDTYFQSFDGRIYTFPATCQYVLAKSLNSGKFTVTIQNAPCGANLDGACIQSVNLIVDEDPRTEITLSHVGEVFLAGQYRISLPYSDENVQIQELSSMFLQVKTAFGLRLQYSWTEFRLYLLADQRWKDGTVGLCGTFNGNIQDDFLSPSGMIESTPHLFGNAWRVPSACSPSLTAPQLDPCDTHQQAVAYASEMCDLLNQDLFSACHEYLSPTPFHQQCRSDTCKCGAPCLCSALAHYARRCRKFSIIVDFRSLLPDCVVTCPATMQYSTCVSSCQRRCSALSIPQHCGTDCEEGCACPEGSFFNHRTHTCVQRSECPCSFLGTDYEPGNVIMTSAGVQLCLNGKLVPQSADSDMCPKGQIYHNCSEGVGGLLGRGVACERTCESFLLNLTCSAHEPCVAGCTCPPGLLKHGDECFEPEACPCLWKGKEYYPGDKVSSPCHQCVCQHGTFQCAFHPCPSMCTTYGDRHYRTFDGLLFDYIGACKVYLVKSNTDRILSVAAENFDCFDNGPVCRKSLFITIGRSFIAFDDDSGKPNPSSLIDRKQRMLIWPAGYFTVIHFPDEVITVLWDRKTTIHIQAGPQWQGKLNGLCGNFDLKTVNEMRTPDNIDATTPQEFGNSWTTGECANSPDIRHPCSLSPLREPFAKRQCAVLLSEVFQACHPMVDVTWFYMNCLADTCACSRGGDCECFCTSVAAYAQRCCHQGVAVDWRSPSLCPYDCEFYNKVLGKGPFQLVTFKDQTRLLAASTSNGSVFVQRRNTTKVIAASVTQYMMTPGLSKARPHDTSRVSFEAADRPNFFLITTPSGQLKLTKWKENDAFWDAATFVLHRDTWVSGYDSLESQAKPGFFLHVALARPQMLKYRHTDSFRKATLFRLTGPGPDSAPGPRCQWRYDSCVSPCFKTCSDPFAEACTKIPQVEGCLPVCPPHMVLDEVTRRCVYVEDCIKVPVTVTPITPSSVKPTSAATTTASTTSTIAFTTHLQSTTVSTFGSTSVSTPKLVETDTARPQTQSFKPKDDSHLSTLGSISPPEFPEKTAAPPSRVAPTLSSHVVEEASTVKVTDLPPTLPKSTTWTSSTMSATSPFHSSFTRLSSTQFPFSSLFWLASSAKASDSLRPFLTTTGTSQQTLSSTRQTTATSAPATITAGPTTHSQLTHPAGETTEAKSLVETPIATMSNPAPPLISESSTDIERTALPREGITQHMDASATPATEQKPSPTTLMLPELPSTHSVQISFPVHTTTVISSKTTDAVISTETAKHMTSATTLSQMSMTSRETVPHSTMPEAKTTATATVRSATLSPAHEESTTTQPPDASELDWQTTTQKVSESIISKIPTATTTTTQHAELSASVPLGSTTSTSERPSSLSPVAERPTLPSELPAITEAPVVSMSLPSTTTPLTTKPDITLIPQSPTDKHTVHQVSTEQMSEPVRPPHQTISSTQALSSSVITRPEHTSAYGTSEATSSKTTELPQIPSATETLASVATPVWLHSSTEKSTTPHKVSKFVPTSTTLSTPKPPPLDALDTPLTTTPTTASPAIMSTTVAPVSKLPITEESSPAIDIAELETTRQPPYSSQLHSTSLTSTTTPPERVTTRLVSIAEKSTSAPPSSSVSQVTTARTTQRSPVTARVTERSTMRPRPTTKSTTSSPTTLPSTSSSTTVTTVHRATPSDKATVTPSPPVSVHAATATAEPRLPTTTRLTLTSKERDTVTSTPQAPALPPDMHDTTPTVQAATTIKVTRDRLDHTSQRSVTTPPPTVNTTSSATVAVSPTRTCVAPYAEIVDECTKYICVNNQLVLFNKSQSCPFTSQPPNCGLLGFAVLVNGDKCCPKWDCPCRCSVFPDLNVITFDGNSVAIYKAASYIVTQLFNETISISVQECPANSEAPLLLNFTNLCLVALNITHKSNQILIDRLQRRLYVNSRYAKPRFKKFGFEIYDTGNMYLIRSPAGISLQWYHTTGMMVIGSDNSRSKLPTRGLCGFCDGDSTNDLTLADGSVVGRSEDPSGFIDSWQVPNTTSYISHSRRRELNCSISDCSSCLAMLENPTFSPCHTYVPPSTFCEIWVRDDEYVNNQCVALAAYVALCHKFNICVEWRRPDFCPFSCPNTLRYQACLPGCTSQSCPNHEFDSDPEQCSGLTEGCVCPEGTLLHRPYSALCIPPDKCACTDSAGAPHAHGDVWKASNDACCMYRCDNDTVVPVEYNCSDLVVPVCHRGGETVVSLADDTSCCPKKVCVCNQTLCDLIPPDCSYGEKLVSYYRQESCCPDFVCECDPELCESAVPTCRADQTLIATKAEGSCCIAHICMCSSCLESPPPLCQDGEVLTVESNATDRCCPSYQCVCEPYRCPQLTCPLGMSVVSASRPGRCCPEQTCECSCDKIASPKCDLGEAAQLDRAFLSDPQNQCACKRYKCVREAVCVFGERGVLRPGQTLVEHEADGLCHTRQCSRSLDPSTGFHLLRTSSTNCSARCQPNQIYIPPKDLSTCCGVCKNISCFYEHENGTTALYKPGKSWVSNCMKFECSDTLSGPTLVSYSFSCPPFNETECAKIGGTVVSYLDGCCRTCTGLPLFPFPVSPLTPTVNTNCERGKEDGKSCQKVTVRMTIRKNDCRSNRPVNIVSCDGKCPSASIYNYNINTYARFCKCCRETGLQRRSVQLYCSGNATWVSYSIQEPTDCSCQWS
ncbi:otogelin [Synchiropus picturatus]